LGARTRPELDLAGGADDEPQGRAGVVEVDDAGPIEAVGDAAGEPAEDALLVAVELRRVRSLARSRHRASTSSRRAPRRSGRGAPRSPGRARRPVGTGSASP